MAKVRVLFTTYMPTGLTDRDQPKWERYEAAYGDDDGVYEIPDERLQEFLDTDNFELKE